MSDDHDVDVLIIGGGVAGCWIGQTVSNAGYTVAIVTTGGLSGGQTAHSHVYLHRGHLYRKEAISELRADGSTLVSDLQLASRLWDEWLAELPDGGTSLDAAPTAGIFGFSSELSASEVELGIWAPLGLASQALEAVPSVLAGSVLTAFRSVSARCLDASKLVGAFIDPRVPVLDWMDVQLEAHAGHVIVGGKDASGSRSVRARGAVLAAGAGNRQLLASLEGNIPRVRDRSSFMLVITDPDQSTLVPISGVFNLNADDGLFLVSRQGPEGTSWLLSDAGNQSDARTWLAFVSAELEDVFPLVWAARRSLRWGYYEAPKAEVVMGDAITRQVRSHVVLDVAENVVACWPTKLTLAPVAAEEVLEHLDGLLGGPLVSAYSPQPAPTVVAERWRSCAAQPWPIFAERFLLQT